MKCVAIALIMALMPCPAAPADAECFPASAAAVDPDQTVSITVLAEDKAFDYTDEPIVPSDFTVAEEIERRRINAPLAEKMELVDLYMQNGADCKTALLLCFPRLSVTVKQVGDYLYRAPEDAKVVYNDGRLSVTGESEGQMLDENRLYGNIYYSFRFFGGGQKVKASVLTLKPKVTRKDLDKNLVLRGRYTTDFSTSSPSRAHNVAHAVKKFGGVSIAPGETLSFNEAVGPRTEENGFKTAKIILNGKYVDGVGGGACQASTAVYNAALLAGLRAEANAHSICPSYCQPGLDAMISSVSDLKITNTTDYPVYFCINAGKTSATVAVYGAPNEFVIKPESEVEKTIDFERLEIVDTEYKYFDPGAASGDRLWVSNGKEGYESATYLKYFNKCGKFIKRVKIRSNVYKPAPQIVAIAP